jgi:uncharacterized protein (TIGR03000 family)
MFYRQGEKNMHRPSWKVLLFGLVMVIALFCVVDQASAGCHGCGAAYGAFPAYTAWDYGWNGCCGDWYGGYRYAYRPFRHGCRTGWYGGWYAGYGYYNPCCYPTYSCCETTAVTSCCGDSIYSGTVNAQGTQTLQGQPTPAAPKKPVIEAPNAPGMPTEPGTTPTPPTPGTESTPATPVMPGAPTTSVTPENSGMLTVWVPYDAKVTINGMATKSTGSRRQFVSYNLTDGFSYKYEVKAEVVRDGKIIEDTKTVVLTAGANNAVAFGFNIAPSEGLAAQ